jgi:hypothetical protein
LTIDGFQNFRTGTHVKMAEKNSQVTRAIQKAIIRYLDSCQLGLFTPAQINSRRCSELLLRQDPVVLNQDRELRAEAGQIIRPESIVEGKKPCVRFVEIVFVLTQAIESCNRQHMGTTRDEERLTLDDCEDTKDYCEDLIARLVAASVTVNAKTYEGENYEDVFDSKTVCYEDPRADTGYYHNGRQNGKDLDGLLAIDCFSFLDSILVRDSRWC